MKLNYRDLVILGILLAIAILIAGFMLLIKPKNEEIKKNKVTLADLQDQYSEIERKIAEIEPLKKKITETCDETNKLAENFVEPNDILNARKVDQYMQHFAEEAEVKVMSLTATDLGSTTLDYYYFTPTFVAEDQIAQADLNGDLRADISDQKAESDSLSARTKENILSAQYSVNVQAEEKENFWKYMELLEQQDETIIINSISFTNLEMTEEQQEALKKKGEKDEEIIPSAQIVVTLYSVYDLEEPNLDE